MTQSYLQLRNYLDVSTELTPMEKKIILISLILTTRIKYINVKGFTQIPLPKQNQKHNYKKVHQQISVTC